MYGRGSGISIRRGGGGEGGREGKSNVYFLETKIDHFNAVVLRVFYSISNLRYESFVSISTLQLSLNLEANGNSKRPFSIFKQYNITIDTRSFVLTVTSSGAKILIKILSPPLSFHKKRNYRYFRHHVKNRPTKCKKFYYFVYIIYQKVLNVKV